ncbi:MAG: Rrf2 family transcriptional regulator [Nitrospirales bacterium]|nr:Rrf2 family transcriptional regulator [Nitrospirales bacterium]
MRFSKKSEYALRAMIELTQEFEHGLVQRKSLAERQNIPLGFLEMILLSLKNAGLIGSRRGAHGGVHLIKSPREVTLGQIIRLLDGPLAPIACVSQTAYQKCQDCPHAATTTCPIQRIMLDVRNAIASVLDHYTLEDFVFPRQGVIVPNLKTQPVSGATQKKKKSSDNQS